jgi:hypothetical protein
MALTDLGHLLSCVTRPLPEPVFKALLQQLLQGLAHMHAAGGPRQGKEERVVCGVTRLCVMAMPCLCGIVSSERTLLAGIGAARVPFM